MAIVIVLKKSTIRKRYGTDKGNETSNDNLLQLNGKKIKLPSEEENNKNRESEDEENHCKYPTKDIPIFFLSQYPASQKTQNFIQHLVIL